MRRVSIALTLFLVLGLRAAAHTCGYDFTQIGVPNDCSDDRFTSLLGINNRGLIIGAFSNSEPPARTHVSSVGKA